MTGLFKRFAAALLTPLLMAVCAINLASAQGEGGVYEPFVYREDFSSGELNAWASYPPNQDTAYDPYVYPGLIQPDDTDTCLVAVEYPVWHADQRLGAAKLLDCRMAPGSTIAFRYHIKTVLPCSQVIVHVSSADGVRYSLVIPSPEMNRWITATAKWEAFTARDGSPVPPNPVRIDAVAVTADIPGADPDVPVFLGLDDIEIRGLRPPSFVFDEPETAILAEWPERIPLEHYRPGDKLTVRGRFSTAVGTDDVRLIVTPFMERGTTLSSGKLRRGGDIGTFIAELSLDPKRFTPGLYRGVIDAISGGESISETPFTFLVVKKEGLGRHPRMLYDAGDAGRIAERFRSERFRAVREKIVAEAVDYRTTLDPAFLVFDNDQFPAKDWLATLSFWSGGRVRRPREALVANAFVYGLLGEREAGEYCRDMMLAFSRWPTWNHPWMEARGFRTYYPLGEFAVNYALAFDMVYDLLTPEERVRIAVALDEKYIRPSFETYVVDNQVTSNSSNWISHIVGGALFAQAAVSGELPPSRTEEPALTGFLLKMHRYLDTAYGRDGSYGEGFRYFNFAMQSFAKTIPAVQRIYGVDFSVPMRSAHLETLWASNIERNFAFTLGDSEPFLKQESTAQWIASQNGPMNSWAWLLESTGDPVLAWLYHHMKEFDTIQEVLHETEGIPAAESLSLGNVRFFRDVGTAVFRSGWKADDFIFVFRSGPFYNHQHMDHGSFFLSDRGRIFLEERYDGEHHYYDDPVYRSHAIQAISHNTILVDRNPQSQETGDPAGYAAGFRDHATFVRWLDGGRFAYAEGDLTGVYRGTVGHLERGALYIKPRTVLLVDKAVPSGRDTEINLLFHTRRKADISTHEGYSAFDRDGGRLFLMHMAPGETEREIVSEPHFLAQFGERPLIERGYLQVSHRMIGKPLVSAGILTSTPDGEKPEIVIRPGTANSSAHADGFVDGGSFRAAVNTAGGAMRLDEYETDGLVLAVDGVSGEVFMSGGTYLNSDGSVLVAIACGEPFAASIRRAESTTTASVHLRSPGHVTLSCASKPRRVTVNGVMDTSFGFDADAGLLTVDVPDGESEIVFGGR